MVDFLQDGYDDAIWGDFYLLKPDTVLPAYECPLQR